MSEEDKSSKTEEPTERKLTKARERGQVPRSREVNNLFMIAAILIAMVSTLPPMMQELMNLMGQALQQAGTSEADTYEALGAHLLDASFSLLRALAPTLALFLLFGLAGGFSQTGFLFSWEPMVPKLQKISLIAGFGRLFSLKSVVEFLKSLFKIIVLGIIIGYIIYYFREDYVLFVDKSVLEIVEANDIILFRVVAGVLAFLIVLSIVDFFYQRYDYLEDQRMTKQEVKDEFKETEGDPFVKSRQRQIRMQRARARMMQAVPKAQVVVTNPTHYAIALGYDRDKDAAPKVVAKGVDHIAQKIRDLAREHDVPLVEDPPLARLLYKEVDLDETIPVSMYETVAKIISYVYSLKKKNTA
jgi:flagellar biosynthetic protein FlhB